ncbi:DUF4148 domain-containing protein [Cupriavidus necator]|uniref:DUF4148 domain-containing protein n=1 Tax=Cupriavidus necator TaxID=106590 RepID=A0A1U9UNQ7_CUPNE|nr:DUF4148 domain-containing protein [Cupriavidus necator]AQV94273.1 DUF4148 domain-containing protein [Cupriavidus necator]
MKSMINALIAASVVATPVVAFAEQSSAPVTRAQVRAELAQLQKAGYQAAAPGPYYPANLQTAMARVAGQSSIEKGAASKADPSAVGPSRP